MVGDMKTLISTNLVQSIMAKEAFVKESVDDILRLTEWIREVFEDGGKLLLFTSPWNVDWATDHNPDLILSEFGNVAF